MEKTNFKKFIVYTKQMADKYKSDTSENVDYQKAIQNLTDILIDFDKFREMTSNLYDAIDTDNEGTIRVTQVEDFVRKFLKGNQIEGQISTAFDEDHDHIFKMLSENESGEVNLDELGKFVSALLRNQVKVL